VTRSRLGTPPAHPRHGRPARLAGVLALALLGPGCANNATFASAADYGAYRATRVSPTLEARLTAAHRYLLERPDGVFRGAVRAYFDHAEEIYYASKQGSRAGLEAYLAALPRGPHKEEAERRLRALDVAEHSRRAELEKTVAAVEARVSGPGAHARAAVRSELDAWLVRFFDPEAFRAPISAAKASLVIPFSLSLPAPHCALLDPPEGPVSRRCAKLVELPYEVEGPQGAEPREATLEITVIEGPSHAPIEVDLAGPDLFLRLEETFRVKAIATDDAAQRAAANARAVTFVRRVFGDAVSAATSCEQSVQPPLSLRLACGGVLVDVIPATSPGDDDRVIVTPLPAAPRAGDASGHATPRGG
jgi:hypothetical protein